MTILGLDPGSLHTGYGLVRREGSRIRALAQGRFSCPRHLPLTQRLVQLTTSLRQLLVEHRPASAAVEALYHGVNPRSLIVLAQARGALMVTLAEAGLPVVEYSPAEVKSAVTGQGRADKVQVARMVRLLLGLGEVDLSADASDALAVAICSAQRLRMDRLERRSGLS